MSKNTRLLRETSGYDSYREPDSQATYAHDTCYMSLHICTLQALNEPEFRSIGE